MYRGIFRYTFYILLFFQKKKKSKYRSISEIDNS